MDGGSNPAKDIGEVEVPDACGKRKPSALVRCAFTVVLSLAASFLFSFIFGFAAIALEILSSTSVSFVTSECKILSTEHGVDLRSSRHCGLTLFSYTDRSLFYGLENAGIQCRDDYYWASIFQVEYKDFFSGRNISAVAEVPREALPSECRPNFNAVWLVKSMFKINETYKCRYAPRSRKADIFSDEIFNCRGSVSYDLEQIKILLMLFLKSMASFFAIKDKKGLPMLGMFVGIITGILISICLSIIMRVVYVLKLSSCRLVSRDHLSHVAARLRHGCLVLAYISAMGWLTLQYGKVIGLKQIFLSS